MSSSYLFSAMKSEVGASTNWLGDLAAAYLPPNESGQNGDCLGLDSLGITGVDCNMVSNFVCQAPDPPNIEPFPSIRFVI